MNILNEVLIFLHSLKLLTLQHVLESLCTDWSVLMSLRSTKWLALIHTGKNMSKASEHERNGIFRWGQTVKFNEVYPTLIVFAIRIRCFWLLKLSKLNHPMRTAGHSWNLLSWPCPESCVKSLMNRSYYIFLWHWRNIHDYGVISFRKSDEGHSNGDKGRLSSLFVKVFIHSGHGNRWQQHMNANSNIFPV